MTGVGTPAYLFAPRRRKEAPIMKNTNLFGVGMRAGAARDLRVSTVWPSHATVAAHAAAGSAAVGIAEQRKRRTAAATDASVDGGLI
jgi:hypothetical protein